MNRLCAVGPDGPKHGGNWAHVQPEVATNTIAASTSRPPCRRRPPPCGRVGAAGTTRWNSSHNSSGTRRSTIDTPAAYKSKLDDFSILSENRVSIRTGAVHRELMTPSSTPHRQPCTQHETPGHDDRGPAVHWRLRLFEPEYISVECDRSLVVAIFKVLLRHCLLEVVYKKSSFSNKVVVRTFHFDIENGLRVDPHVDVFEFYLATFPIQQAIARLEVTCRHPLTASTEPMFRGAADRFSIQVHGEYFLALRFEDLKYLIDDYAAISRVEGIDFLSGLYRVNRKQAFACCNDCSPNKAPWRRPGSVCSTKDVAEYSTTGCPDGSTPDYTCRATSCTCDAAENGTAASANFKSPVLALMNVVSLIGFWHDVLRSELGVDAGQSRVLSCRPRGLTVATSARFASPAAGNKWRPPAGIGQFDGKRASA